MKRSHRFPVISLILLLVALLFVSFLTSQSAAKSAKHALSRMPGLRPGASTSTDVDAAFSDVPIRYKNTLCNADACQTVLKFDNAMLSSLKLARRVDLLMSFDTRGGVLHASRLIFDVEGSGKVLISDSDGVGQSGMPYYRNMVGHNLIIDLTPVSSNNERVGASRINAALLSTLGFSQHQPVQ